MDGPPTRRSLVLCETVDTQHASRGASAIDRSKSRNDAIEVEVAALQRLLQRSASSRQRSPPTTVAASPTPRRTTHSTAAVEHLPGAPKRKRPPATPADRGPSASPASVDKKRRRWQEAPPPVCPTAAAVHPVAWMLTPPPPLRDIGRGEGDRVRVMPSAAASPCAPHSIAVASGVPLSREVSTEAQGASYHREREHHRRQHPQHEGGWTPSTARWAPIPRAHADATDPSLPSRDADTVGIPRVTMERRRDTAASTDLALDRRSPPPVTALSLGGRRPAWPTTQAFYRRLAAGLSRTPPLPERCWLEAP